MEQEQLEFTHVPYASTLQAKIVMDRARGIGDRSIDLPTYADSQLPKRLEVAAVLANSTIQAAGEWDLEANTLNPGTIGGKRMEIALARVIHDHDRRPMPESKDVRWLSRRLVVDMEMQAFAQKVIKTSEMLDNPDKIDELRDGNPDILKIAERCDQWPEERRSMQMQAMGWYENMPKDDRDELHTDISRQRMTPNQEIYLETLSEPFAKPNGLPKMESGFLDNAVLFPMTKNLEQAQAMINYYNGADKEPGAHQYFGADPFFAIASAVFNTIPENDLGQPLSTNSGIPREVVALARVMGAVDVAQTAQVQITNHDVAAMMFADVKLMANIDRQNLENKRAGGKVGEDNAMIASGGYSDLALQPLFFPAALTDASVHVSSREQMALHTEVMNVGLEPGGRFQVERANEPDQRVQRMEMLRSVSNERRHEQATIALMQSIGPEGR